MLDHSRVTDTRRRPRRSFALWRRIVLFLAAAGLPGSLASTPAFSCSLSLVLAMDGSASVNAREHTLQLNGLADALQDPEVIAAIEAVGGIWVTSFEWSGRYQQLRQLGWRNLTGQASAREAAARLRRAPRGFTEFPTALGYALGYAAVEMKQAPAACARKVIDVAGDGVNNEGFGPDSAYRAFDFEGVTVNGLVIAGPDTAPVEYYRQNVLKGPGAFVEVAATYEDYADAMKRKLLREIFGNGYAALP
ncbi:DUF1194 domain-containing protein [Labrenzia aggregata]|uniref:DUF1194 domain-containing protein n=1 Tax=Roseibium aggregatum TaxID=187304 RepID=A0A939IZ53_9HYPH|nr:DUF1194 domain-containing protein [Roseibium aggregatum]